MLHVPNPHPCASRIKREGDFVVIAVDHEPNGALATFLAHLDQELPEIGGVGFDCGQGSVALNDDRLVKDKNASSIVIASDAATPGKSCGAAKEPPQDVKGVSHPTSLIDGSFCPVTAWNKQDEKS